MEVNGGEFQGEGQWGFSSGGPWRGFSSGGPWKGFSSGDPWRDIQVKVNGGNFSGGSK